MADKKISELDAITGANTAATDVFVVVDTSTGQTKKITREELNNAIEQDVLSSIDIDTINGDFSVNGNINLGDNNKAIFGAGSDLQIYHDGSNSYVKDAGTGDLYIQGTQLRLQSATGESFFVGVADGSAYVYHNGSAKLSTTATGIDVTGTVTADGLTVSSGSNQITLDTGDQTTYGRLDVGHFSNGAFIGTYAGTNAAANILRFGTSGSERFRITSSGNVGIGRSNPSVKLDVGTTSDPEITMDASASGHFRVSAGGYSFAVANNSTGTYLYNNGSSRAMVFGVNETERMRINSSGNVLVGTTDTSLYNNGAGGNTGVVIESSGTIQVAKSSNACVLFNRLDSDGIIAGFRKDGAEVGSIGVNGSSLTVGRGSSGVHFYDGGTKIIVPANPSTGGDNDATVDLGYSSSRFRNLYLSSGVYVGGTGSANHLDDYEEGTFVPTVTTTSGSVTMSANDDAAYTKIGRQVTVQGRLDVSSVSSPTGNLTIGNLPFAIANLAALSDRSVQYGFITIGSSGTGNPVVCEFVENTSEAVLRTEAWTGAASILTTNSRIQFSWTYFTT